MDSRLRGNDVVLSFHSKKASISVRSILFQTFCDSRLRGNDVVSGFDPSKVMLTARSNVTTFFSNHANQIRGTGNMPSCAI